jgi:hypothetical protein
MTDQQINIAIAESLGWHSKSGANGGVKWVDKDGIGRNGGGLYGYGYNDELKLSHLPDYTSELNVCHEFELEVIYSNDRLPKKYTQQIKSAICREVGVKKAQMDFDLCITATARQRCEAYLKTIGKWIE